MTEYFLLYMLHLPPIPLLILSFSLTSPHLIVDELGGIFQVHFLNLWRGVTGGQCQATQSVSASTPLLDDSHDLILDNPSQWYTGGANTDIGTPFNDTFRCTLLG